MDDQAIKMMSDGIFAQLELIRRDLTSHKSDLKDIRDAVNEMPDKIRQIAREEIQNHAQACKWHEEIKLSAARILLYGATGGVVGAGLHKIIGIIGGAL